MVRFTFKLIFSNDVSSAASFRTESSRFTSDVTPSISSFTLFRVSEHNAVSKKISLTSKNLISSGTFCSLYDFKRSVSCCKIPFLQHMPAATGLLKTKLHKLFCTSMDTSNFLSSKAYLASFKPECVCISSNHSAVISSFKSFFSLLKLDNRLTVYLHNQYLVPEDTDSYEAIH